MSSFDTGDSPAIKEGALRSALRVLEKAGYNYIRPLGDIKGTYAYLLSTGGYRVFLVARRSRPYMVDGVPFISSQKVILIHATSRPQSVLLVAMLDREKARFLAFDPHELKRLYAKDLSDTGRDNYRHGSKMVNYEYDLGVEVTPLNLVETMENIKLNKKQRDKYSQVNETEDAIIGLKQTPLELRTTVNVDLVECDKCGAMFSEVLPECPTCKREASS